MKNENSPGFKVFVYALLGIFLSFFAYAFTVDDSDIPGFNAGCHPKVSIVCWPVEY